MTHEIPTGYNNVPIEENGSENNFVNGNDNGNGNNTGKAGTMFIPFSGVAPYPEDLYRQVGFQIAILSRECPIESFDQFIIEHKKNTDNRIDEIRRIGKLNIDRYKEKISNAKPELDAERARLQGQIPELDELLESRNQTEQTLCSKRNELIESLQDFYNNKHILLTQKQNDLTENLQGIIDNHKNTQQERFELQRNVAEEYSENFNEKTTWLKSLKSTLLQRYQDIQDELKRNDLRGVGPALFNFLIGLGTSGAIVAGWFFSVFITTDTSVHHSRFEFDNLAIAQLVGRLINFSGTYDWFVSLGILLGFIALVFGISWAMYLVEKQLPKEPKDPDKDAEWEWNRAGIHTFEGKIRARSWFSFWLKSSPWIFVVGVMLILMAYGGADEKFAATLTGESIGFLIAIALSGVAYIYVSNSSKHENIAASIRARVVYLAISFLAFNLFVGILLLYGGNFIASLGFGYFKLFFSLVNFVLIMCLTALIIGYGIYYKGIVRISSFLNWKINNIDDQIRKASGIDEVNTSIKNLEKFQNDLEYQLKEIAEAKQNQLLINIQADNRPSSFIPGNENTVFYPSLSESDSRLFPEYDLMVRSRIMICQDTRRKLFELDSEISLLKQRKEEGLKTAVEVLELYNNRFHQWNNEIIWEEQSLLEKVAKEDIKFLWEQVQLKDGFHLGMVYRMHHTSSIPGFYKPCELLQPVVENQVAN